MVAELVARQQSGSPINGETPNQNHTNSNMPTNGHNQNIMNNSNNNSRNGNHRPSQHQHISTHNISRSSSPSFLHETHSNGSLMMSNGGMSPNSQDGFPPGYDMNAHLKRKELFTQRKQREFIPDNKKDDSYWDRRRRNNEAAKRSREKRRFNDMVLEQRVVELTKENHVLKAQLDAIKDKYNITGENLVNIEQIMATIPTVENVLSITKRAKLSANGAQSMMYPESPSPPVQTSVIHQPISIDSPPMQSSQQQQSQQMQPQQHSSSISPQLNSSPIHHPILHANHHYPLSDVNMTVLNSSSPMRSSIIENPTRSDIYRSSSILDRDSFHSNENGSVNGNNTSNGNSNGNGNYRYASYASHGSIHHNDPHHTQHYESESNSRTITNGNSKTNVIVGNRRDDLNAHENDSNVLNLSRRRNGVENDKNDVSIRRGGGNSCPTSPYEISSGAGSSTASGDDEQCCDNQPLSDLNNSLPLKLRHKSHLGDKDAATALLALQNIKQEPNSRLSPAWDGEGSSDERDSGISIGAPEWAIPRKIMIPSSVNIGAIGGIGGIGAAIGSLAANLSGVSVVGGLPLGSVLGVGVNGNPNSIKEENVHLKTQIARLESEVASIKNMMILNTTTGSATTVQ